MIELNPVLCDGHMHYLVYTQERGPANKVGGDGGGPKEAGEKYNKSKTENGTNYDDLGKYL